MERKNRSSGRLSWRGRKVSSFGKILLRGLIFKINLKELQGDRQIGYVTGFIFL